MSSLRRITECLDIDLEAEVWRCNRCSHPLGSARENYKTFCLVHERNPHEIHPPVVAGPYTLAPDPEWCRIIEFSCPSCGVQIEVEYLPPGHPITWDIELDIDALKRKHAQEGGTRDVDHDRY